MAETGTVSIRKGASHETHEPWKDFTVLAIAGPLAAAIASAQPQGSYGTIHDYGGSWMGGRVADGCWPCSSPWSPAWWGGSSGKNGS